MTDEEIIALLFHRNEAALNIISEKYISYSKAISYDILKNNEDAEECANDMLIAIWESIPPKKPNSLKAYIGKITRNISINRLTKNNAQKRGADLERISFDELDFMISSDVIIEEEIFLEQARIIINTFLSSLNKRHRIIFVRKYWYMDSIEDIAKQSKLSKNNVKVILFRLREKLKKELVKGGFSID